MHQPGFLVIQTLKEPGAIHKDEEDPTMKDILQNEDDRKNEDNPKKEDDSRDKRLELSHRLKTLSVTVKI